jgi:hypothetical protein
MEFGVDGQSNLQGNKLTVVNALCLWRGPAIYLRLTQPPQFSHGIAKNINDG